MDLGMSCWEGGVEERGSYEAGEDGLGEHGSLEGQENS